MAGEVVDLVVRADAPGTCQLAGIINASNASPDQDTASFLMATAGTSLPGGSRAIAVMVDRSMMPPSVETWLRGLGRLLEVRNWANLSSIP